MTVTDLMTRMTVEERANWLKFFSSRPWPDEAADLQNALLCQIVANLVRGKDQRPWTIDDFRILGRKTEPADDKPKLSVADQMKAARG